MYKFARFILFSFILITQGYAYAQVSISTVTTARHRTTTEFTADWMYLSTDLYLFNANKFDYLINQVRTEQNKQEKKKTKKGKDVDLEHLVISVNLKSVFGKDMIYPIYSFMIKNEKDKPSSQIGSGYEVVRIIKDLPVQQTTDELSADIKAEIFGKEDEDKMLKQVSGLLKNAEKLNNPPAAVLSMVAELGNFIESTLNQKQYVYSNTIRLYDETPFNRKLHSVNIFQFMPSSLESSTTQNPQFFKGLDTLTSENLNRQTLERIINLQTYPYLVVVNYKSKYLAEQIPGDEVDYKYIENRRQKTITRFAAKEIPEEIYQQEMSLMDYLVLYLNFKNDIQQYELNFKSKVVDDFSQSFFRIMQDYRFLKNAYAVRLKLYANSNVFKEQYKAEYDKIGFNAELYLQSNIHLRNINDLVNTLFILEHQKAFTPDSAQREDFLKKLYAVQLPASEKNSDEVKAINLAIRQIETDQFRFEFAADLQFLDGVSSKNQITRRTELMAQTLRNTQCVMCRDSATNVINRYNARKEVFMKVEASDSLIRSRTHWNTQFFFLMKKHNCFESAFKQTYPDGTTLPTHIEHLQKNFVRVHNDMMQMDAFVNKNCSQCSSVEIFNHIFETNTRLKALDNEINALCNLMPEWCNCP